MKFKSDTDIIFDLIIFGTVLLLVVALLSIIIKSFSGNPEIIPLIIILPAIGMLLWTRFGTYYVIIESRLLYRCGPIRGAIEIGAINTLVKNQTLWVGVRPALARKGIIVKYNKYDDIYISPKDKEGFISELLKRNKDIQISEG